MVLAKGKITDEQLEAAQKEIKNLESQERTKEIGEAITQVFESLEQNLSFVGLTGLEDKLQDEVSTTIGMLREANINICVLTGDKKETAIEIGKSSNMILPESLIINLPLSFDDQIGHEKIQERVTSILEQELEDVGFPTTSKNLDMNSMSKRLSEVRN